MIVSLEVGKAVSLCFFITRNLHGAKNIFRYLGKVWDVSPVSWFISISTSAVTPHITHVMHGEKTLGTRLVLCAVVRS